MEKHLQIILITLLTVSALTGCASQNSLTGKNPLSEEGNAARQNSESAINQTDAQTDEPSNPLIPVNAAVSADYTRAYKKLIAYKTGDYGQQSIADFHAALAPTSDALLEVLAAIADVIAGISHDDENYDFFATTMTFTTNELYCEHMGEEVTFMSHVSRNSRPCDYVDEAGETVYAFHCYVDLYVPYAIHSPKLVTVEERDKMLLTFQKEMQNYLDGLSEAEIAGCDFKKRLTENSDELIKSLSNERMELLSCEFKIEIIGEAEEGS